MMLSFLHRGDYCHHDGEQQLFYKKVQSKHRER